MQGKLFWGFHNCLLHLPILPPFLFRIPSPLCPTEPHFIFKEVQSELITNVFCLCTNSITYSTILLKIKEPNSALTYERMTHRSIYMWRYFKLPKCLERKIFFSQQCFNCNKGIKDSDRLGGISDNGFKLFVWSLTVNNSLLISDRDRHVHLELRVCYEEDNLGIGPPQSWIGITSNF